MQLATTFPTLFALKRNSSLNWMALPEAGSSRHQGGRRHELPSQHLEQAEYDEERTKYLESEGYRVIRFWNNDVMNNIDGVILAIIYAMGNENGKD